MNETNEMKAMKERKDEDGREIGAPPPYRRPTSMYR
jgi:hypothetical protein